MYHTEEKEIRNSREIEKYIYHGSEHYRVVYVTTYHVIEYMDNNIIKEYDIDRKYNGKVYFSCEEEAELYAKHTTGSEYKLNDDHYVIQNSHINDNVKETIKSFDVVTLEPLPINVVKECI